MHVARNFLAQSCTILQRFLMGILLSTFTSLALEGVHRRHLLACRTCLPKAIGRKPIRIEPANYVVECQKL